MKEILAGVQRKTDAVGSGHSESCIGTPQQ